MSLVRDRIEAVAAERPALAEAPGAQPDAAQRAVLANSLRRVVGARRMKPAVAGEER
jgi:hypothetical protein